MRKRGLHGIICLTAAALLLLPTPHARAVPGDLLQTYRSPVPLGGQFFGISVAGVEDDVLVGAFGFDASTSLNNSGAAYLMDAETGGVLQTFLNPHQDGVTNLGGQWRVLGPTC